MSALFTDESNQKIEDHVAGFFANHRSKSFDDTLQHSQQMLNSQLSLPTNITKRLSSDSNRLSSFGLIAGHEIVDTSVKFPGVVSVDDHCEYPLLIDTGVVKFTLHKRYSQFRDLRQQLLSGCGAIEGKRKCRNGACLQLAQQLNRIKFPRRKLRFKVHRDDDVRTAKERLTQLQFFLNAVLRVYRTAPKRQVRCCVNSECIVLKSIRSFLDLGFNNQISEWKAASCGENVEVVGPLLSTSISSPACTYMNGDVGGHDDGVRRLT